MQRLCNIVFESEYSVYLKRTVQTIYVEYNILVFIDTCIIQIVYEIIYLIK